MKTPPKKSGVYLNLLERVSKEKTFIILILVALVLSAISVSFAKMAMWLGFVFAAYSAVANDSIQSLGTFIESNKDKKWWILWLFTGIIFIGTIALSWFMFDGDVTYQRLLKDGKTNYPHPDEFSFFQVIAPVVLLILTRLRMPVSTTFLMLSVFSADTKGITSVVGKSVSGYIIAFILSFVVWYFAYDSIKKHFKKRKIHISWTFAQWIISGTLWSVWLMQDGANIAVYLPRILDVFEVTIFIVTIFLGLGILFYLRGDKIQQVVSEKVRINDVRAATLIDLTYVLLLIYKLFISTVPMSTTWVFLGIIGGREIAVSLARNKKGSKHRFKAIGVVSRDFVYASIGLLISVSLAAGANPKIRDEVIDFFINIFTI